MRTVVASGVFDIIHPGHILFLEAARALGDRLVVIVASDESTEKRKGKPVLPAGQRLSVVSALKPVDEALVGDGTDRMKPIRDIRPDVIALGPNQDVDEKELEKSLKSVGLKTRLVRINQKWESPTNSSKKILKKINEI